MARSEICEKIFHEEDKVIIFNSRLRLFFGKLKSRWYGPFVIYKVLDDGHVVLISNDGSQFKVNGHREKRYREGECLIIEICYLKKPSAGKKAIMSSTPFERGS